MITPGQTGPAVLVIYWGEKNPTQHKTCYFANRISETFRTLIYCCDMYKADGQLFNDRINDSKALRERRSPLKRRCPATHIAFQTGYETSLKCL